MTQDHPVNQPDGTDYDFDPKAKPSFVGWRIPSQDHNGHTERVQVRLQPGHLRMLQNIVASKQFPLRDTGDAIRLAVHRLILWLEAQASIPIPSVMRQLEAVSELLEDEEQAANFVAMFDRLQKRVDAYVEVGSPEEAGQLVRRIYGYLSDMPDGGWKARYLGEMEGRYTRYAELQPPPETRRLLPSPPLQQPPPHIDQSYVQAAYTFDPATSASMEDFLQEP